MQLQRQSLHLQSTRPCIEPSRENETQLEAIRELMLGASLTGAWLTLAEIAEATEFGEASISAQLRHLRKPRYGCYRVEKRRRDLATGEEACGAPLRYESSHTAEAIGAITAIPLWEYRVLPPMPEQIALPIRESFAALQARVSLDESRPENGGTDAAPLSAQSASREDESLDFGAQADGE